VQAANLAGIFKKDSKAKVLIHAGYRHPGEEKAKDHIPMGWWFKKMTGIDPFTIEQTGMTEGSEFEYGRIFYQYFNARFTIPNASVLFQNRRPFNPLEEKGFDLIIMHPSTTYQHNRPTWLTLEGDRKPQLTQPTEKLLFFLQAYYESEYSPELVSYIVPADQTYITNREGYYCLFLRKGKYRIVMRDISYKILSSKVLEVL
jgi:hypothetical protein